MTKRVRILIGITLATLFAFFGFPIGNARAATSDVNGSGCVDVVDLGILLSAWGRTDRPSADINQNGSVDIVDFGILLSNWGCATVIPPPPAPVPVPPGGTPTLPPPPATPGSADPTGGLPRNRTTDPAIQGDFEGAQVLSTKAVTAPGTVTVQDATTRKALMLKLAAEDPGSFLDTALSTAERGALPAGIQPYIEQQATVSGILTIIHEDNFEDPSQSKFIYIVEQGGTRYTLFVDGSVPTLSGARVSVSGYTLGSTLVAPAKGVAVTAQAPTPKRIGTAKVLALLVQYLNSPAPPFTPTEIADRINAGSVRDFFMETSGNLFSYTIDAQPWYTQQYAVNDSSVWDRCGTPEKRQPGMPAYKKTIGEIAMERGIDLGLYDGVVIFENYACWASGWATVGTIEVVAGTTSYWLPVAWVAHPLALAPRQPFDLISSERTVSHEWGHNLGVAHTNAWECGVGQSLTGSCTHLEYGNRFDVMGISNWASHFNSAFKKAFGWLGAGTFTTITRDGEYSVAPLAGNAGLRGAEIVDPETGQPVFAVEYRRAMGFDSKIKSNDSLLTNENGIMVNWKYTPLAVRLLDMSPRFPLPQFPGDPANGDFDEVTLNVGSGTFTDAERGIVVGPVTRADATGATFNVSFIDLARMASPAPGSALLSSAATFEWDTGTNVSEYWLGVGTTPQSVAAAPWGDIFAGSAGTATSKTVVNIPLADATIYVRLWSKVSGVWYYADYSYTTIAAPSIGAPIPGTMILGSAATFSWSSPSLAVSEYWLGVGTSAAAVAAVPWGDIFAQSVGGDTSATVTGIPTGKTIFVRLWSKIEGRWYFTDVSYATAGIPVTTQPPPGTSIGPAPQVLFRWNPGNDVSQYWLGVGTTPQSVRVAPWGDVYAASTGLNTSAWVMIASVPSSVKTIFVRLWYLRPAGWEYLDYRYTLQ